MTAESDPDALMREAARWFARMRGPDADASRPALEAWLAGSAERRRAYNRAGEVFALGKLLADSPPEAVPPPAPRRSRALWLASSLPVLAVAAAAWLTLQPANGPARLHDQPSRGPILAETLATGTGERRESRLADGSRVSLAPGSRLAVDLGPAERRLVLVAGRARFDVAHEARPFTVAAGGALVTARGTLFEVALTADHRVAVNLERGRIDVALPGPDGAVRRLAPGDRIAFRAAPASTSGETPVRSRVNPEADLSRDYDRATLAALVSEANRHAARPIRISDPALGARLVSGRFRLDDSGRLADRLAGLFDLEVDRTDPAFVLLKPR